MTLYKHKDNPLMISLRTFCYRLLQLVMLFLDVIPYNGEYDFHREEKCHISRKQVQQQNKGQKQTFGIFFHCLLAFLASFMDFLKKKMYCGHLSLIQKIKKFVHLFLLYSFVFIMQVTIKQVIFISFSRALLLVEQLENIDQGSRRISYNSLDIALSLVMRRKQIL